jgi:hypothetical protein
MNFKGYSTGIGVALVLLVIGSFIISSHNNPLNTNASASTPNATRTNQTNSTTQNLLSNSTRLNPPTLSDTDKQALINTAMNVTGIKSWSNQWQYATMDFLGNSINGNVTWNYTVVRLLLPSNVNTPFYCKHGWEAGAKIDLITKQVVYAYYPTIYQHDCNTIEGASSPPDPSFAVATQNDVATTHWYGNKAQLVVPNYSSSIFTDMNSTSVIEQILNDMWNQQCKWNGPQPVPAGCFTQAGWVITNYNCSFCNLTANTEDLIYIDQSVFGSYTDINTLLTVTSGNSETAKIACSTITSNQTIYINFTNQVFTHTTKIPCSTYQSPSDTTANSVFLENWNDEPSVNWSKDIQSSIVANNAYEFDSSGIAHSWLSSSNVDINNGANVLDSGSLVLTGNLTGSGATWSSLNLMPTFALGCSPPTSGSWFISSSCVLNATKSAPSDVIVQSGKVLIIPSPYTLTIPFTTNKLSISKGGTVLVEPGGKISHS